MSKIFLRHTLTKKNSWHFCYSDFLKRHLHLRNRLLDQGYKQIRLIRSLKKFIFRYQYLVEIYSVSAIFDDVNVKNIFTSHIDKKNFLTFLTSLFLYIFTIWKCIAYNFFCRDGIYFDNVWRKNIFDIYVTEYGTALTTILPILFLYLNTVTVTAGTFEP
jgi:hypothetical protein